MGFGTRYYSTRRNPGLYRTPSRLVVTGRAANRLGRYRLRAAIKSIAEKKFYDNVLNFDPTAGGPYLTNAGTFFNLTDLTQGSGQSQRIGDKCTGSSLEIRFDVRSPGAGTTDPYLIYRLIVFIWKDDTVPVVGDILEALGTTPPLSPFNHDTKVKRKILYDGITTHFLDPTTKNSENVPYFKRIILPLHKLKKDLNIVNFQGGTIIAVNHIYALMISDGPNVQNQTWDLKLSFRYNFIDM